MKILICQVKEKEIPQLIPLNWILSRIVLLILLVRARVVFRENVNKVDIKNRLRRKNKLKTLWCW